MKDNDQSSLKGDEQSANLPLEQINISSNIKSALTEEYYNLMRGASFEPINQQSLVSVLLSEGIKYNREYVQEKLHILIEEYSSNYEALRLNVSYGFFCSSLHLINIDTKKQLSNSGQSFVGAGAFGKVEKYFVEGGIFAIKSVNFQQEYFVPVFRQVVKECFLMKIASELRTGPKITNIFGFDIVAYKDCFDFSMQLCEPVNIREIPHTLERNLSILHHFSIVHMDIKSQNIAFSREYNDNVFIDFGLSRAIKEKIGQKSYTMFTGSLLYCSSEMLELYNNETKDFVDLFYNDAYSLHATLQATAKNSSQLCATVKKEMQQMKPSEYENSISQSRDQIIYPNQNVNQNDTNGRINHGYFHQNPMKSQKKQLFSSNQNLYFSAKTKIDQICQTLNKKYKLFIFSNQSQYSIIDLKWIAAEMSNPQMACFIFALPQSIRIITQCKQYLNRITEQLKKPIDIFTQQQQTYSKSAHLNFRDRFSKMQNSNNQDCSENFFNSQEEILLNFELAEKCKFETYILALIKMIRINSYHTSFQKKISACKIFNQLYMKQQVTEGNFLLYRNVIRWIFLKSLSSNQANTHQLLRNCIQTIVFLEIVPENSFIEAYFAIFDWSLRFTTKVSFAFEFITSLQFVREKYRKTYDYERLLEIFMTKLNKFVDENILYLTDQQQIMISNGIKLVISCVLTNIQNGTAVEDFINKKISIYSNQAKKLYQEIKIYLICKQLLMSIGSVESYVVTTFDLLFAELCRLHSFSKKFSYAFLVAYNVLCFSQDFTNTQIIFQIFLQHYWPHQEVTYFRIYFFHQVNCKKLMISQMNRFNRKQYKGGIPIISADSFNQIFVMLSWMIQNTDKFHLCLRYLILNLFEGKAVCADQLYSIIKSNLSKIISLSNKYHKKDQRHNNDLKIEITTFNKVKVFISFHQKQNRICQSEKLIRDSRQIVANYYRTISNIQCFQCKISALFQLKTNFQNITLNIAQSHQYYLSYIDGLIFALKHRELKQRVLPLMILLIRVSTLVSEYASKFDLKPLFHEYVRESNRPHYYLSKIPQRDLFLNIYMMVQQRYPQDQIITLVYSIAKCLGQNKKIILIDRFYTSLSFLVKINRNDPEFKRSHDEIVKGLFSRLQHDENPYLALYFSDLLGINIKSGIQQKMLRFICLSLNQLNKYPKQIVLSHYYGQVCYFYQLPARKEYYLNIKHFRNRSDQLNLKDLIKIRIKKRLTHNKKQDILRLFLEKYHINLTNVQ